MILFRKQKLWPFPSKWKLFLKIWVCEILKIICKTFYWKSKLCLFIWYPPVFSKSIIARAEVSIIFCVAKSDRWPKFSPDLKHSAYNTIKGKNWAKLYFAISCLNWKKNLTRGNKCTRHSHTHLCKKMTFLGKYNLTILECIFLLKNEDDLINWIQTQKEVYGF